AVGTEEPMRMEHDVEIEIAVAPAVDALAALPPQAQALPIGRAFRDACLDGLGHMADAALRVDLGHPELQVHLRPAMRVFQREMHRHLEILARNRHRGAAAGAAASTRETFEEIGEIDVVERERASARRSPMALAELLLPVGRRAEFLPGLVGAPKLVVGRALLGILEGLVGLGDLLEFLLALRIL